MNKSTLTPAQRLIVAMDFDPDKGDTQAKIIYLGKMLAPTGVIIKINVELRSEVHKDLLAAFRSECGLPLFMDLKLCDIEATLKRDGKFLRRNPPAILTVMAGVSSGAIKTLKDLLPDTVILGVTVLTDISPADAKDMYECDIPTQAMRFARHAVKAGVDGLVCSPLEAAGLRAVFPDVELVTPGVRDPDEPVKEDDQKRVATLDGAFAAGATRIVLGRPIVDKPDPYAAAMRFRERIAKLAA
jgi:orotidine-5'-phosphate decarboxylase